MKKKLPYILMLAITLLLVKNEVNAQSANITAGRVEVPQNDAILSLKSSFTVEAWVYMNSLRANIYEGTILSTVDGVNAETLGSTGFGPAFKHLLHWRVAKSPASAGDP